MNKYIIIGIQGCGKGTQTQLLQRDFDLVHISVGEIIRWHIENHTKLAARIHRLVNAGTLVPDDVVEQIVHRRLEEHDWNYGFVLDGFPRNVPQAEFLMESYDVDNVIHITISDEVVLQRVLARRLCSKCGLDYNFIYHRPAAKDICDICGGELVRREDDNEHSVRERINHYHLKTEPVLDLFRTKKLMVDIDGDDTPENIQSSIRRKLALPPV